MATLSNTLWSVAVEIGFLVRKISAALNSHSRGMRRSGFSVSLVAAFYRTSAHFRALLFEHRLA